MRSPKLLAKRRQGAQHQILKSHNQGLDEPGPLMEAEVGVVGNWLRLAGSFYRDGVLPEPSGCSGRWRDPVGLREDGICCGRTRRRVGWGAIYLPTIRRTTK